MTTRRKIPSKSSIDQVIKRREKQQIALFVDGSNLDRACKRLHKRMNMAALLKSLSAGKDLLVARYYTIVPFEDDARQLAYLDAVERAGFEVIVKRLPPKGIERPITVDVELASDIIYYSYAKTVKEQESAEKMSTANTSENTTLLFKKSILVVCPSQDLAYSLSLANNSGTKTTTVDFGKGTRNEIISSSDNWIDLTEAEGIWM